MNCPIEEKVCSRKGLWGHGVPVHILGTRQLLQQQATHFNIRHLLCLLGTDLQKIRSLISAIYILFTTCFAHCCDTVSDKKKSYLPTSRRKSLFGLSVRSAQQQEQAEVAGHIIYTIQKLRKMIASVYLAFSMVLTMEDYCLTKKGQ